MTDYMFPARQAQGSGTDSAKFTVVEAPWFTIDPQQNMSVTLCFIVVVVVAKHATFSLETFPGLSEPKNKSKINYVEWISK